MKVGRLIFNDLPRYKLHIKNISIVNRNKIKIELNTSQNAKEGAHQNDAAPMNLERSFHY